MSEAPLICTVAIELSRSHWMIGVLPPRSAKVAVSAAAGGDTGQLLGNSINFESGLLASLNSR